MRQARKTKRLRLVSDPFKAFLYEVIGSSLINISSPTEREVKKATRDLNQLLNNIEPLNRIETVQRKYSELLADMKKLERDHAKNKKRADLLQKESDKAKSENNKTNTLKEKLEKLCRELTKDNKKMKVHINVFATIGNFGANFYCRTRTSDWKTLRSKLEDL